MFQTFISVFEWARDLYHGSILVWCIVVFVACFWVNRSLIRYLYDHYKVLEWYYWKVVFMMIPDDDESFDWKIFHMFITIVVGAIETAFLVFILFPLIWTFIQVIAGFISGYVLGFFE